MSFLSPITTLGRSTISTVEFIGGVGYLLRDALFSVHDALFTSRGRRLGWRNLTQQMGRVGGQSIPLGSLVRFCFGAIPPLPMAPILPAYGPPAPMADTISIAT